eukprot:TRINITY_DN88356_c0_g1_i1.p1 TRINITY_DN88356_c0_g1~~TRINITY_DN88356_c0_g1_i1.p1  ORF type:complete len:860 (-),score=163.77 TRINITY_DN88356_c0_g1_i1:476-3055(-)
MKSSGSGTRVTKSENMSQSLQMVETLPQVKLASKPRSSMGREKASAEPQKPSSMRTSSLPRKTTYSQTAQKVGIRSKAKLASKPASSMGEDEDSDEPHSPSSLHTLDVAHLRSTWSQARCIYTLDLENDDSDHSQDGETDERLKYKKSLSYLEKLRASAQAVGKGSKIARNEKEKTVDVLVAGTLFLKQKAQFAKELDEYLEGMNEPVQEALHNTYSQLALIPAHASKLQSGFMAIKHAIISAGYVNSIEEEFIKIKAAFGLDGNNTRGVSAKHLDEEVKRMRDLLEAVRLLRVEVDFQYDWAVSIGKKVQFAPTIAASEEGPESIAVGDASVDAEISPARAETLSVGRKSVFAGRKSVFAGRKSVFAGRKSIRKSMASRESPVQGVPQHSLRRASLARHSLKPPVGGLLGGVLAARGSVFFPTLTSSDAFSERDDAEETASSSDSKSDDSSRPISSDTESDDDDDCHYEADGPLSMIPEDGVTGLENQTAKLPRLSAGQTSSEPGEAENLVTQQGACLLHALEQFSRGSWTRPRGLPQTAIPSYTSSPEAWLGFMRSTAEDADHAAMAAEFLPQDRVTVAIQAMLEAARASGGELGVEQRSSLAQIAVDIARRSVGPELSISVAAELLKQSLAFAEEKHDMRLEQTGKAAARAMLEFGKAAASAPGSTQRQPPDYLRNAVLARLDRAENPAGGSSRASALAAAARAAAEAGLAEGLSENQLASAVMRQVLMVGKSCGMLQRTPRISPFARDVLLLAAQAGAAAARLVAMQAGNNISAVYDAVMSVFSKKTDQDRLQQPQPPFSARVQRMGGSGENDPMRCLYCSAFHMCPTGGCPKARLMHASKGASLPPIVPRIRVD